MSKTYYSNKKLIYTGLSFNKTSLSQEDNEKSEVKINNNTKDSWKFFINFKNMQNLKRTNSFKNIHNFLTPNKNNPNYVPISNKYSIIRFNKAPTLKDNLKEINKIIRRKKLKNMEDYNNYFNTILINESRSFRSNLYITGGGMNSLRSNSKSNILDKNRSNEHIVKNRKYNLKYNNNSFSVDNLNFNIDTGLYSNSVYNESNYLSENIKNNNNNSNQCSLLNNSKSFPKLNIKKEEEKRISSLKKKNEENNMNKKNNITRMRMEINDAIFNNLKFSRDFAKLEQKVIKFKALQKLQNKKLKIVFEKKELNLDKKYNILIHLKDTLEKKYIIYSEKMNNYLDFLAIKIKEIKLNLKIYEKNIKSKNIEIEKLIFEILKNQTILESLVDKRNFLLQIKEKFKNPPIYYEELLIKDSKKLIVGNSFLSLKILEQTKNKNLLNFISSVLEIKNKIKQNIINIDNLKPLVYISNNFIKIDPIFDSVDEFLRLYNYLKDKSLNYLKKAEIEKKSISQLKKEYEEENYLNNNDYLKEEIKKKEVEKNKIMIKNNILVDTYYFYKNNILKKINDVPTKLYNFKNKVNQKRFINIDSNLNEKYSKQLKHCKYGGILLLKKLIDLVKYFSIFKNDNNDYYYFNLFEDKKLENTLNIDISEFNDDNITLIDKYVLILVTKYESICKYILNKNKMYSLNDKNKKFMKKKKDEILSIKRKQLSTELKEIIKKKKNEEIKKIIEKSNKSLGYIGNKINIDSRMKRNQIQKINKEKILSYNKKNYLEKEFNDLTKYNDNEL